MGFGGLDYLYQARRLSVLRLGSCVRLAAIFLVSLAAATHRIISLASVFGYRLQVASSKDEQDCLFWSTSSEG